MKWTANHRFGFGIAATVVGATLMLSGPEVWSQPAWGTVLCLSAGTCLLQGRVWLARFFGKSQSAESINSDAATLVVACAIGAIASAVGHFWSAWPANVACLAILVRHLVLLMPAPKPVGFGWRNLFVVSQAATLVLVIAEAHSRRVFEVRQFYVFFSGTATLAMLAPWFAAWLLFPALGVAVITRWLQPTQQQGPPPRATPTVLRWLWLAVALSCGLVAFEARIRAFEKDSFIRGGFDLR